jgi:hypothetical protein
MHSRDKGGEDAALAEDVISLFDSNAATDVNEIEVVPAIFPINLADDCKLLFDSGGTMVVNEIAASTRVSPREFLTDRTPSHEFRLSTKLEEE